MKIKKQRRGIAIGDKVRQLKISDQGSPIRQRYKKSNNYLQKAKRQLVMTKKK